MAQLIIIRGNSGSGKTTLAQRLQAHYGRGALLISQDNVRRTMLMEKVTPNNLSVTLTETIAAFGYQQDLIVIVEGFYEVDVYGDMLERLRRQFAPYVYTYYYDLTFDETVRRHSTRHKKDEFTSADMKRWWKEKDYLNWANEVYLKDTDELENVYQRILQDVSKTLKNDL